MATLSDRIIVQPTDFTSIEPICLLKDVEEKLKEFMELINEEHGEGCCPDCNASGGKPKCKEAHYLNRKAKEIFGERLIK